MILGAGPPHDGGQHPALRSATGRGRVLDWALSAMSWLQPSVQFIGGYQLDEIRHQYPELNCCLNSVWETTGAVASLFRATLGDCEKCYVSYADILFRESLVRRMDAIDADVLVAVDLRWRDRFEGRSPQDLARCEKVNVCGNVATRLGPDIDPRLADAEFVGLVRFGRRALETLRRQTPEFIELMGQRRVSQLLEVLRMRGSQISVIDVDGDWAELNETSDLARFILGTKAQTLQRLQSLVTKSCIKDQLSFTLGEWEQHASALVAQVQSTFLRQRLVVRSSALFEDCFSSSEAGVNSSILNVDSVSAEAVRDSITKVASSYSDGDRHNQILVQPMVENVRASGVVFTRTLTYGAPYRVINWDDVSQSTDSITSGASREHKTLVIHHDVDLKTASIPADMRNLVAGVQEIEGLLDLDSLDLEFAITSNGVVNILQVRPIAVDHGRWQIDDTAVRRSLDGACERFRALQTPSPFVVGRRALFGVMPDWNPAEIIGIKPGRMAISLYRNLIMDETWATQRAEYGYRDVRPLPLLVTFAGHPYVDIRGSFNSFVPAELPDELAGRLVDFYLGWLEAHPQLHDKVEFEVVPTCCDLYFERWEQRLSTEGHFSAVEIDQLRTALCKITAKAFTRTRADLAQVAVLEERFARVMVQPLPPLERACVLLEDCRRHGTMVFSHLARSAFVAVTLLRSALSRRIITKEAMDSFLKSMRTVTHALTEDAVATKRGDITWEKLVATYGHLRPGSYNILSTTYADDPERYLRPIVLMAADDYEPEPDPGLWKKALPAFAAALAEAGLPSDADHVESFMRDAITGREYAKFVFTRSLSAALDCLAEYGASLGLTRDDLFHIPVHAFFDLRTGSVSTADPAAWLRERAVEGRLERQMVAAVELPPLLLRESDFFFFFIPCTQANFVGDGRVVARCVDLSNKRSDEYLNLSGLVVLISQADPGYDWLFGRGIGGLITMYGGANSHMAIRAAEFGLPAAIGVGEAQYQRFANASVLELDAGNRNIRIIQ